ncbi:MAG TPA: GAF domain-containing protein, partial [Steroidobacteraceae bacterium]
MSLVRPDLLVYLPVLGALLVMWGSLAAYCFVERKLTLERTVSDLSATATTLADFNDLAQQATGTIVGRSAEARSAAMWRALLRHPMASIWVEKAGVITGGQPPSSDLSSYLVLSETRGDLTVHIAIARSVVLSEWRRFVWQWSLALVVVSLLFAILVHSLSRALRQRAIAEGALRQHDALLNVVTQSASKLLGAPHNEAIDSVLALIGRTVGVRRVHLSQVRLDEQCHPRLTVRNEWCSPGMPPMIHHPLLQNLDMAALTPGVTPGIMDGTSSFFVEDIDTTWVPLFTLAGMRSFLNITVPVAGAPWGLLSFIDSAKTRRQWSWAELDALKTLAGLVGVAVARERY